MKRGKKGSRFGTLLFLVPVVLISAIVVYGIWSASNVQDGTLTVNALSSHRYYTAFGLNVTASVGSRDVTTPMTLSLAQGAYTVTFSAEPWFTTPTAIDVTVAGGKHAYAVGTYDPIVEYVSVGGGQFNSTSLDALHGVTPVVWVNPSSSDQIIYSQPTGRVEILPMQNYTYIFQHPGTFVFSFPLNASPNLQVTVS